MKKTLITFFVVYFPLSYLVGLSWIQPSNPTSFITFAVWQLMLAKVIYDSIRMLFVLILPDTPIPKKATLGKHPAVALLYVCRDDIVIQSLNELGEQSYPNYKVFVLDDSRTQFYKVIADQSPYKVVRRNSLGGFKAGNINHWLESYGNDYKYFVIFDNDSRAKPNFIEEMVLHAEHEDNKDIAIFQSKVLPWNIQQLFPRLSGALAAMQMAILGNFGNKTGTIISFGHNNLHRTAALLNAGGFDENVTSEDTAATLKLDQLGYRTILVDVPSYEEEPINILRFQRRAIRWAGQTAYLFQRSWVGVSGSLKFEVCRQLLYYLINSLFYTWLIGSMIFYQILIMRGELSVKKLVSTDVNYISYGLVYLVTSVFIIHYILHFTLALRHGTGIKDYIGNLIFSLSVSLFTIIPVSGALLSGLSGRRVNFNPSNSGNSSVSFFNILIGSSVTLLVGAFSIVSFWVHDENPWAYFNGWWATVLVLIPIFLYVVHNYPLEIRDGKRRAKRAAATQTR
jgi:cellulose synthase/poly-beta-1,6-N-acetylglucosamine synthase-like glycosyltransferase